MFLQVYLLLAEKYISTVFEKLLYIEICPVTGVIYGRISVHQIPTPDKLRISDSILIFVFYPD